MPQVAGSGAPSMETPSSSEKGGTPEGVPNARNDSTSVLEVGVKVRAACCQPLKPMSAFVTVEVNWISDPKLTANCSELAPWKPDC